MPFCFIKLDIYIVTVSLKRIYNFKRQLSSSRNLRLFRNSAWKSTFTKTYICDLWDHPRSTYTNMAAPSLEKHAHAEDRSILPSHLGGGPCGL